MNFIDQTLVKLADPQTRPKLFTDTDLEQIAATSYDVSALPLQAPWGAAFDELSIGFALPRLGQVEGTWQPLGGIERTELRLNVAGLSTRPGERVEAWWRGAVIARAVPAVDRIIQASVDLPPLDGIDKDIIADLGALPGNPAVLEQERRSRFSDLLKTKLDQPDVLTDARLDQLLTQTGADSVSELLERMAGVAQPGTLSVTYSPPANLPPTPRRLPISALILIRSAGFAVADLLMESKAVLEQAASLNIDARPDPTLPQRRSVVVVWAVPVTVFDDNDWPGANQTERRSRAAAWLSTQGIALAAL